MGGYGSGSWHRLARRTKIEEVINLDMAYLRSRRIVISENYGGDKLVWFNQQTGKPILQLWVWSYAHENDNRRIHVQYNDLQNGEMSWVIPLSVKPLPYGNMRFWFVCPLCKTQRCYKIYLLNNSFGCRGCHGLVHNSSQRSKQNRLWDQYHKMNAHLGGGGDLEHGIVPLKRKGMHSKTYEAKIKKLENYYDQANEQLNVVAMSAIAKFKAKMMKYNHLFDDDLKITLE